MGYAGGALPEPTYEILGDHSEAIQIAYDPSRISYERLLTEFWSAHTPGESSWSRQYRSAIFVRDDAERELAERSKRVHEKRVGHPVHTAVEDAGTFWQAEAYHQKHSLRYHKPLMRELLAMYPDPDELVRSTAVTRINAWVAGHGDDADVEAALDQLGLSEAGRAALIQARR